MGLARHPTAPGERSVAIDSHRASLCCATAADYPKHIAGPALLPWAGPGCGIVRTATFPGLHGYGRRRVLLDREQPENREFLVVQVPTFRQCPVGEQSRSSSRASSQIDGIEAAEFLDELRRDFVKAGPRKYETCTSPEASG